MFQLTQDQGTLAHAIVDAAQEIFPESPEDALVALKFVTVALEAAIAVAKGDAE
ncbi:hypothetical protein D3C80_387960 [compost metagenome]